MGKNLRHFKALMRKNWINWKRTPLGSLVELLLPAVVMGIILLARKLIKPQIIDVTGLSMLQHPRFPVTSLNSTQNKWTLNANSFRSYTLDESFQNMMRYANYTNTGLNSTKPFYNPLLDLKGPFMFTPPHCLQANALGFNSPVIAYIKNSSPIQRDLVAQLTELFSQQHQMNEFLINNQENFDLSALISGASGGKESSKSRNIFTGTMNSVSDKIQLQSWPFVLKEFESKEVLFDYIVDKQLGSEEKPGICYGFQVTENRANDIELELIFNDLHTAREYWSIPSQKSPAVRIYQSEPRVQEHTLWEWYGFGYMQNWVANTILKRRTGIDTADIVDMTVPMPMKPTVNDSFKTICFMVLPLLMMVAWVPMVYRTTYRITQEKQLKTKESMFMMGLKPFPYWLSWFTYYLIGTTIISILMFVTLLPVFYTVGRGILFVQIFLYGLNLFGIILAVQSLFTNARNSAVVAVTVNLLMFIACLLGQNEEELPMIYYLFTSICPPAGQGYNMIAMMQFDQSRIPINFSNWGVLDYRGHLVKNGILMQVAGFFFWLALGSYMEVVMPSEYGKPLKPWFMFQPSFWCPKRAVKRTSDQPNSRKAAYAVESVDDSSAELNAGNALNDLIKEQTAFETKYMNPDFHEPVPSEISRQELNQTHLRISDLFKQYSNGFKAVNGVNLQMYSDQIFVLLGHNGAGKTTTISMLTGLFPASEGDASVFGVDMFNQTEELRQFMGVCPQHEVLFELLTPEEHLDIFYDFKGADPNPEVKWAEINKLMVDVGVDDKRHHIASQLSGGNQRKVSVCIALCGGSKFVLLDEPSSGLDLSARRQMWNMLKEHKKDKIIILTTHYMDEADILGDRIGIMSGGRITCLGTSMFLKHKFGVGYTMTIVKTTNAKNKTVLPFLRRNLGPEVKKLTEVHQEMTFQIPSKYSDKFKMFFKVFDFQLASLQIQSYGVSITTLEEVFLKVGHLADPSKAIQEVDEKVNENDFDPYNPVRRYSHEAMGQLEMDDFDKRMDELFFKKKQGMEEVVTSNLLDPKSLLQADSEFSSADGLDDPSLPVSSNVINRPSDQLPLNKVIQAHNPELNIIDEDDVVLSVADDDDNDASENEEEKKSSADMRRVVSEIPFSKLESLFEQEKKVETKYSLKTAKLDRSFCYQLGAVFFKNWSIIKRNKRMVFSEIIMPCLVALLGQAIMQINFYYQSESRIVSESRLPHPISILINQQVQDTRYSDTQFTQVLWNNIPEFEDAFAPYYAEKYGSKFNYTGYQNVVAKHAHEAVVEYPYLYGSYQAFQINRKTQQYKFFTYVNLTCQDCGELFPQFMYESILKVATNDPEFKFKVRNTPYPMTERAKELKYGTDSSIMIFFALLGTCVLASIIMATTVRERVSQLKHMQTMTGLRLDAFWIGNFVIDFLKFIPIIFVETVVQLWLAKRYNNQRYSWFTAPFGILPLVYGLSFAFSTESSAQTFILFFLFVMATVVPAVIIILRINQNLWQVGDILLWIFRMVPSYAVANSMLFCASGSGIGMIREAFGFGKPVDKSALGWENNPSDVFCLLGTGLFWIFVLIAIENGLTEKVQDIYEKSYRARYPRPNEAIEKDEDVRVEENRVKRKADNQLEIKVQDFRKCYMVDPGLCNPGKPFMAVEKLSFGLSVGECFCLLGVNGAGKSTTFKSLTCEVKPTSGKITIAGHDIQRDWEKVRQLIGYCPQTNPIFDTMSVEEHIDYYARIKGISAKEKGPLIEDVIKELGLESHRTKAAGTLSGGNKRKLSVAIAIIGNPQIILLDEPSAGMDPESRRFMWQVVAKISNEKTSAVILTTHLMEEAEALSTKMGIMVKGGIFKCFGSSQHIKNKFGTGYVIDVKIRTPTQEELQQLIDEELPPSNEVDIHNNKLVNLKATRLALSKSYSKNIVDFVFQDVHTVQTASETKSNSKEKAKAESEFVSAFDLASSLFTQNACIATIEELCQVFGEVQLLEKYGGFMSMRVARQQKTIGFVFGYLDEIKIHCDISEYSVSQTTLEQIFQGFANLKFEEQSVQFYLDNETGDLVKS